MHTEATNRAVAALRALVVTGERYRQAVALRFQVGVTETQAVSHLMREGDLGHSDLAAKLGLTTGAVTALVDRLERAGVAERTAHESDRRRSVVRLTETGRALAEQSGDWLAHAFDDIDEGDLPTAVRILEALTAGLERQAQVVADGYESLGDPAAS